MVALVVHDLKNGRHCLNGYCLLLGPLHGDVAMLDVVGLHKRDERLRKVLVDKRASRMVSPGRIGSSGVLRLT